MEGGWPLECCGGGRIGKVRWKRIRIKWKRTQSLNNIETETGVFLLHPQPPEWSREPETGKPRPLVVRAACFYPEDQHLCWKQPELLLPSSLSPPGTITASNRSGRSSISMGSGASDAQNWYLISNFSKPFSQYFIVTSSLPQLTNLFCTHIAHHWKTASHGSGLSLCLSFPLQLMTCRFRFHVSGPNDLLDLRFLHIYYLGKVTMQCWQVISPPWFFIFTSVKKKQ